MHPETSVSVKTNADRMVSDNRYQTMKDCDLMITTSGTASLETFFLGVPQVFFHIPSFVDMHLFRRFIRINEYNLANLYFGKKMVPTIISRNPSGTVLDIFDKLVCLKALK
jgi:lipid-A-disaccharide synthase